LYSCANQPKYYLVLKLNFTITNPLAREVPGIALRSNGCRRAKGLECTEKSNRTAATSDPHCSMGRLHKGDILMLTLRGLHASPAVLPVSKTREREREREEKVGVRL
jgi:hypothetical protein